MYPHDSKFWGIYNLFIYIMVGTPTPPGRFRYIQHVNKGTPVGRSVSQNLLSWGYLSVPYLLTKSSARNTAYRPSLTINATGRGGWWWLVLCNCFSRKYCTCVHIFLCVCVCVNLPDTHTNHNTHIWICAMRVVFTWFVCKGLWWLESGRIDVMYD